MLPVSLATLLLAGLAAADIGPLLKRAGSTSSTNVCEGLTISKNDGGRKVALVIDSSGSMFDNDPGFLRVTAAKAFCTDFLISASNSNGKTPDLVTVIDFNSVGTVIYPLGDPSGAITKLDTINASGGTDIADGINKAIAELTKDGTQDIEDKTAIVVFTDGESAVNPILAAIKKATDMGIRVSFGFLSTSIAYQDESVQLAIWKSKGVYATITAAAGSRNYINYVLLNGLTNQDNPQGYSTQLLAGLAETHLLSGTQTVELSYAAEKNEAVSFAVTSISLVSLQGTLEMGSKLAEFNGASGSYGFGYADGILAATAPRSGTMKVKIKAVSSAPDNSLFNVLTNSSAPIKNCTVGVGPAAEQGLKPQEKFGIGVGTAFALCLLVAGVYFAYKHCCASKPPAAGAGVGPPVLPVYPPHRPGAEKPPTSPNLAQPSSPTPHYQPMPNGPPATYPPSPGGIPPYYPPVPLFNPSQAVPPRPNQSNQQQQQQQQQPQEPPYNPEDYHDPENCSCDEPSGDEEEQQQPQQQPQQPQQQPGNQGDQGEQSGQDPRNTEKHEHRLRLPRIKFDRVEKHHHHPWLSPPHAACEDPDCPLNRDDHKCGKPRRECPCRCRDNECPVTKQRLAEHRRRLVVANARSLATYGARTALGY